MDMDTWLIAQCMARLPRLTYFSHPESSLEDFFSAEASTMTDASGGSHRGDCPTSVPQRAAPHELRFLRSLSQSLDIPLPNANGGAIEHSFRQDRDLSRGHSESSQPSATADQSAASQLLESLGDHRSGTDSKEAPTSLVDPISGSNLDGVSGTDNPEPALPQVTVNASSSRYRCDWEVAKEQPCGEWIEGGSKEVWVHVRTTHGLRGHYSGRCHCKWSGCKEKLKVSSLQRHLAKHLDIRWRCSNCDMIFARYDYARRHIKLRKECHGAGCHALGPGENDQES